MNLSLEEASCSYQELFNLVASGSPKRVLLAGGKTPIEFYRKYLFKLNANFALTDERITPELKRKNYESLRPIFPSLINVNFPSKEKEIAGGIGEINEQYERFFPPDICILGMGEDGHYASIFPKMKIIFQDVNDLFIFSKLPNGELRFSVTKKYICMSKKVYLLIGKDNAMKRKLLGESRTKEFFSLPISEILYEFSEKISIIYI
ncbi:MAG: 6-phosphogluconolactonase [SAR86 cluster bacterium]|nr:6-phosphogluconolactonase [SAR86 cluster bacterium]